MLYLSSPKVYPLQFATIFLRPNSLRNFVRKAVIQNWIEVPGYLMQYGVIGLRNPIMRNSYMSRQIFGGTSIVDATTANCDTNSEFPSLGLGRNNPTTSNQGTWPPNVGAPVDQRRPPQENHKAFDTPVSATSNAGFIFGNPPRQLASSDLGQSNGAISSTTRPNESGPPSSFNAAINGVSPSIHSNVRSPIDLTNVSILHPSLHTTCLTSYSLIHPRFPQIQPHHKKTSQ